jgi:hypothetical protein
VEFLVKDLIYKDLAESTPGVLYLTQEDSLRPWRPVQYDGMERCLTTDIVPTPVSYSP